jgi:hypothetical protein
MSSPMTARASGDAPRTRPISYGRLQGLAARFAKARLAGDVAINRATGWPILLDWPRGLREAVTPGTAPELLLALPALPKLLERARYLGARQDPRRRADVRRLHGFAAAVDISGRPIALWLVAREDPRGSLHFDRLVPRSPLVAPRADGGVLPDGPEARTRALRAVLARASSPPRRQEGGEAPGGSDDDDETSPLATDAPPDPAVPAQPSAPDASAANPPESGGQTANPANSDLDLPAPNQTPSGDPHGSDEPDGGSANPNPVVAPDQGDLDPETIFNQRQARLADLKARGIDPKTDPVWRDLARKFVEARNQRVRKADGIIGWGIPEVGSTVGSLERLAPWLERIGPSIERRIGSLLSGSAEPAASPAENLRPGETEAPSPSAELEPPGAPAAGPSGNHSPQEEGPTTVPLPMSPRGYPVAYSVRLKSTSYPGVPREEHIRECNEALIQAMEKDPALAAKIGGWGIKIGRTLTGLAPRTSPKGWAWHHVPDVPGLMELIRESDNKFGKSFYLTHPGGKGGYSIWGVQ